MGCAEQTILIHAGSTLQPTGLKGFAVNVLGSDNTAHLVESMLSFSMSPRATYTILEANYLLAAASLVFLMVY